MTSDHDDGVVPLLREDLGPRLGKQLLRHLLVLEVVHENEGDEAQHMFVLTGFVVDHRGLMFWVTAEHCLVDLATLRDDPRVLVKSVRWVDQNAETPEAAAHPTSLEEIVPHSKGKNPPDVGVVLPRPIVQRFLRGKTGLRPLSLELNVPDGTEVLSYLIVGLPHEIAQPQVVASGSNWHTSWTSKIAMVTCGLDLDPGHDDVPIGFWSRPECAYGRIDTRDQLVDIGGMSGGPVFELREAGNWIHYQLAGIQSAWLPDRKIVRVAKPSAILELIDPIINELIDDGRYEEPA